VGTVNVDAVAGSDYRPAPARDLSSGRKRLIDPRDWHHLRTRRFDCLRLHCAGCRQRAAVLIVPVWCRRKGVAVVRAGWPPNLRANEQAA
jgi:hypothetical protein